MNLILLALEQTDILVGIIGAIAAVLAASLPYYFTKKNEIAANIKKNKLDRYDDLLKKLTTYLQKNDSDSLGEFILTCNRASSYANHETLNAIIAYLDSIKTKEPNKDVRTHVNEIFLAIRKDVNPKEPKSNFKAFDLEDFPKKN